MKHYIKEILLIVVLLSTFGLSNAQTQCNANFTYQQDSVGFGIQYTDLSFVDTSFGDYITSWNWDFGNGTSSSVQNPYIPQMQPGTYYVCLTIITNDSCSSTYCDSIAIIDPCAGFYLSSNITNDTNYTYTGAIDITVNGGASPYTYYWSNGKNTEDIDSLLSGNYNVTVYDDGNCSLIEYFTVGLDTIANTPTNTISGNIYAGSNLLPSGIVLLINNNNIAIDYTHINNGVYNFDSVQTNQYKIYAIPYFNLGQNYFPKYFPTYNSNVANWAQSNDFMVNSSLTKDINLVSNSNMYYGLGKISGNIYYTSNSGFETGIYMQSWFSKNGLQTESTEAPNTTVLLLDSSNTIVDFKLTDMQGYFTFDDLEYKTYKVYVEKSGKNTQATTVTLTDNHPEKNNIYITIGELDITGINKDRHLETQISVYPNPFVNFITIDDISIREKTITIKNILSQKVLYYNTNEKSTKINLNNLEKGIYILTVYNDNNYLFTKKIIKK